MAPNLRLARGLADGVERSVVDGALNLRRGRSSVRTALLAVAGARGSRTRSGGGRHGDRVDGDGRWLWRVLEGRAIQGGVDRLSHQADSVGRFLQRRELHTLQEHLLLVVGGLAGLLVLFYLGIQGVSQ